MKLSLKLITLFPVLFHGLGYADSEMKHQCEKDGGIMIYNKLIDGYNASIMWRPESTEVALNAISVKINGRWYGALAEDRTHGNSSMGLSSLAQAAYLIGMPVNACIRNNYLRGLESVN
ncbi:putative AB5 enterotoxin binding subunit YtxB [Yersinia sp. LJYL362]|uniref:putative AB5 enterotoxin binding subunit YtxB n=1 Tax=Yersinia sp. LJYL362 TaxID=3402108 RepID=UPI003AB79DFF